MTDHPSRRFLVVGRVGEKSVHRSWIADAACERNWDLQLSTYVDDEALVRDSDLPAVFDKGPKWDAMARHFMNAPELLDQYDYVMLPDDDLIMEARDINRLFEIMVEHDLILGQPALTPQSYFAYPILLRCPQFRLRYSSYLECMSCCFKSSYLKALLPVFERHITGWGVDLVWTMLMKNPAYRSAIIDEVPMTHTRPLYSGSLYKVFTDRAIDPWQEIDILTGSFTNFPYAMIVYGGVLKNGREVGDLQTRLIAGLHLLSSAPATKHPFAVARAGAVMLMRMLTKAGWLPVQLEPKETTSVALIEAGKGSY